jgi:hypothetical protein
VARFMKEFGGEFVRNRIDEFSEPMLFLLTWLFGKNLILSFYRLGVRAVPNATCRWSQQLWKRAWNRRRRRLMMA